MGTSYDPYKVTQAFNRLFRNCRLPLNNPNDPDEAKAVAADYYAACEGYTTGAIVDTTEDFLFGRVEGVNRTWAPNIAQFSSHLRSVQSHLNGPRSMHNAAVKQIEQRDHDAEIEAARTPESMARVRSMVEAFEEKINPKTRTPEQELAAKIAWERLHKKFEGGFINVSDQQQISITLAKQLGVIINQGEGVPE